MCACFWHWLWLQGTDALKELFSTVGLGWAVYISDLPVVAALVDILYQVSAQSGTGSLGIQHCGKCHWWPFCRYQAIYARSIDPAS